jgi:hypothetical protein
VIHAVAGEMVLGGWVMDSWIGLVKELKAQVQGNIPRRRCRRRRARCHESPLGHHSPLGKHCQTGLELQ